MKCNENTKTGIIMTTLSTVLFAIFTILVKLIDVKPVGPASSEIGFAQLNSFFNSKFGYNETIYKITDLLGYLAVLLVAYFAFTGLIQLIKRKSLKKVDMQLYILAIFYIIILAVYVLFEFVIINYRPVMLDGCLEASYPSSHTVLAICIYLSSSIEFSRQFKDKTILAKSLKIICIILSAFTVAGRAISGVHWITDIIGGMILSSALMYLYKTLLSSIEE